MISRRKILSKSRDDINLLSNGHLDDSEDVWYQKETLFKDHIQEVLNKWNQIDDEIWAKVVILERNRRVAKAYARAPVLTINGSDVGFDGFKIGLLGFDNPLRDKRTHECRRHIGYGIKIKMDENGNILIKRQSRASVFVKHTTLDEESAISNDIFKLPQGALEPNKPFILFDMKKFQVNVTKELKKAYPNRRKLENQCLCAVAFVKSDNELLKCPIWMLIINMVAIDMLKSQIPMDHLPGLPATTDEENYSICRTVRSYQDNQLASHISSSSSNGSCKKEPPELPPRKTLMDEMSSETPPPSSICRIPSKKHKNKVKKLKKQPDDPYYCGMKARIPNFVAKLTKGKKYSKGKQECTGYQYNQPSRKMSQVKQPHSIPNSIWGAKSLDSGLDSAGSSQSPYRNYTMYYRFQAQPSRGYIPVPPGTVYIGEWD